MSDAQTHWQEAMKFLYLCATSGQRCVPSKIVDDVWHTFLLWHC